MKYTEQEFKFDHIFDLIRYVCSSLFLAPARFTNEITKKISYLPHAILMKVSTFAVGINGLLFVVNLILNIRKGIFSPLAGRIPLLAYILSLGFSCIIYYKIYSWSEPTFKRASKDNKHHIERPNIVQDVSLQNEDLIEDDSLEEVEVSSIADKINANSSIADEIELSDLSEEEIGQLDDEVLGNLLDRQFNIDGDKLQKETEEMEMGAMPGLTASEINTKLNDAITNNSFNLSAVTLDAPDLECMPDIADLELDEGIDLSILDNLKD